MTIPTRWRLQCVNVLTDQFRKIWKLFRRYPKQPAGTAVFEHPEGAVRPDLYVTNAMADVPAFRPLGGRAGNDDANEGPARQAAHQRRTLPLREHLAVVEDEVSWRDNRCPIELRLGQIRTGIGARNGHAIIVDRVGDQRPAVVFARLDQIKLVPTSGAM